MGLGDNVVKERLNIIFLLDHSGSMGGARIAQLNHAMPDALLEMQKVATEEEAEVAVRVVAFGSTAKWYVGNAEKGVDIGEISGNWKELSAMGSTDTAGAIDLALTSLKTQYLGTRNYHPVVVLVTDGRSDDPEKTQKSIDKLKVAMAGSTGKEKIIRIAIGVQDYYEPELKAFASTGTVDGVEGTPLVFKVDNVEQLSQCLKGIAVSSLYSAVNGAGDGEGDSIIIDIDPDEGQEASGWDNLAP